MTLLHDHRLFKGWEEIATDDLVDVCRLLVKRADSANLAAYELEELRAVAAELRRRRTSLEASAAVVLQ